MSEAVSPATTRRYGVKMACSILGWSRSSFYSCRTQKIRPASRRGPKPRFSDAELLEFINKDLSRTPFKGEGHRKVCARLRVLDGVRVSRKRVLRIMRDNKLLSPFRGRRRQLKTHEGRIVTEAPNIMWAVDGSQILTVKDGHVWLFVAVEHFNSECVGWHVSKPGTRIQALEPVAMGLTEVFGGVGPDVARGLELRMDHGSQYLSDHFQNQIKFWGIAPSFAFVSQPQTNGVVERFFRTLKEQIIHGRIFTDINQVRDAVAGFIKTYNNYWLLERLGFMSPVEYRHHHLTRQAA